MRRIIASAKKALHINKRQSNSYRNNHLGQSQVGQMTFNSISPGPLGGYTCWDNTKCSLCSRFLDRRFMLNMFTSKFEVLGKITDLLTWSQVGERCSLSNYISSRFIEETGGEIPLEADVIVRWDTRDTAIEDGRRDEITSFTFELTWWSSTGMLNARTATLSCFTNEGKLI